MHEVERFAVQAAGQRIALDHGYVARAEARHLGPGHLDEPALTLESHDLACRSDSVREQCQDPERAAAHVEGPRSLPEPDGLQQPPGGWLILAGLGAEPGAFGVRTAKHVLCRAPGTHASGPSSEVAPVPTGTSVMPRDQGLAPDQQESVQRFGSSRLPGWCRRGQPSPPSSGAGKAAP